MRSILAVVNVLGWLLALFSGYYLLPIITALIYREDASARVFGAAAGITLAVGAVLVLSTMRFRTELKPRDGYLLVSLGWLAVTAAAALPMMYGAPHLSFTDAFFESMSGLSTTGSTVIAGLDNLPHTVNLWRCALHWLGGMQMYRAETPGPVKDAKLTPRITETARMLWLAYAGLTLACFVALLLVGMSPFEAVCHAFTVMSLGGFSTHDVSVAWFNSVAVEVVMTLFMVVAAINFSTHFVAMRRRDFGAYRRDPEARWVLVWIGASVLLITAELVHEGLYPSFAEALRHATFTTVAMATTTGLVTEDFSLWPIFASMWLLFLSCVVPSTGSTGGGIKLFRALIMIKQFVREMFVLVHPSAVAPLKIAGQVVPNRVVFSVLAFIFVYFMTVVILTFALLSTNMDFISAMTAAVASINNAGPGLGQVGPATNYSILNDKQTWICTLAMFLGRIELFTFLILFSRNFWRK